MLMLEINSLFKKPAMWADQNKATMKKDNVWMAQ